MNLNAIETLTLLGAIQGLGLSSILFFSKKHRSLANRVLAIFVSLFSLHILREIFESHGYMQEFDLIKAISLTFTGYYGPLLYLYTLTLLGIDRQLTWKHSLHFVIAIITSATFSIAVMNGIVDWSQMEQYPMLAIWVNILQVLVVISTLVYLYLSFSCLREYRYWLNDNFSTTDKLGYQWLTWLITGFISLLLIWVVVFGADLRFLNVSYYDWVFDLWWLTISIFIYWIGYFTILKPEVFTEQFKREPKTKRIDLLDNKTIEGYKNALIPLLEQDKVYLNPELTLQQLAAKIDISDKKLSQVLNQGFNLSFYNLINQYRVEEVKRCLLLPQNSQSKLEVLAYEAGFKSASTFNRQFKNITQMTPKAFRETCIN